MQFGIVVIAGPSGCGKTTLAHAFGQHEVRTGHVDRYLRAPIGAAIREEVAADLGLSLQELESDKEACRELLVECANRRLAEDPLYWLHAWEDTLCAVVAQYDDTDENILVIVDDVRRVTELQFLVQHYGRAMAHTVVCTADLPDAVWEPELPMQQALGVPIITLSLEELRATTDCINGASR
jgi:dephospho-CoA kinase